MQELKTDILVIGAGSGGLSVAAGASQMGADVILLEGHKMGGDCLNFGCVPSKALIASGKAAYAQAHASAFGVADAMPQVDYAAAKDHVQSVIAQIEPMDSQERFEGFGVKVIREYGRFISPTQVQAGDHLITARRVVVATGSSPLVPPLPGAGNYDVELLMKSDLPVQRQRELADEIVRRAREANMFMFVDRIESDCCQ